MTHKTVSDDTHIYGKCNVEATLLAAKELSDRAFKLYIRMNLHQDKHTYALSPVAIQQDIGMTDKRYREAVKELIEKGYLVQQEKYKSLYIFFEYPQKDNEHYEQNAVTPDDPARTDRLPGKNGQMTRRDWVDDPSILGGEIEHNITSHTTEDTTDNNCALDDNKERDYQSYLQEYNSYFQRKQKQANPLEIPLAGPESNANNIDWENDDLPF